ncbi:MAG: mannonate dehydratase [Anaerolineae bacterium]
MKLGLGLYRWMLTRDNFRFARQAGATHIVAHLTDYFASSDSLSTGSGSDVWGVTRNQGRYWTYDELQNLVHAVEAEGLKLEALENFDPAFWSDILLDGPQRAEQMEGLKGLIRNMGRAGIPIMGYNFSLAGVWGRTDRLRTRGDAVAVGYVQEYIESEPPIPNGEVWNMVYDPDAPPGTVGEVDFATMWARRQAFLDEILPVAEDAGVRLAAHPDDPPLPVMRGTARLITQHADYQRLIDANPSPANALEFCVGTLAEMTEGDIYACVEQFSSQNRIGYVHLRNVVGKVPNYHEVFIDEGDTDMYTVLSILHQNGFDGVLIPDHTPQMTCDAPWHAGMAYALGWMRATLSAIERENS